jgi:hypothetical protein
MKKNRTLILTIPAMLVLIGLIVYQYVYLGVQKELISMKESQAIKTRTLEKYISLIAEKPEIEKNLTSLKEARDAEDAKLIEGQTLSLAAANLQEMVKDIVARNGGTISSERVGKPEDLETFKIIIISIDTVLPDTGSLSDILYAIETQTPSLTVKELDIRVRNFREPRELLVKLDVSALTRSR